MEFIKVLDVQSLGFLGEYLEQGALKFSKRTTPKELTTRGDAVPLHRPATVYLLITNHSSFP
ncbi:hypothetical protein AF72_07615 [Xylella taiwanensis]|uniref:Uncharacterized protein n=1 Tax=Xylella taiwanensis TaxID=1444770 RepID=Z9JJR1_9GAMM|nr:hypothetical protein AB672_05785 [Xylella taiwanensis]EWS78046.1 hypothetical protein AF72_07615 [Xylella taiwanensis]